MVATATVTVLLLVAVVACAPLRGKRQSDQRLAQLQTMAALEAMGGKLRQVPIGYGTVDVHKVGRKRAWWGPDAGAWDQADADVDSAAWWPAPAMPAAYSS